MIVEALINLVDMTGDKTFDAGDIITMQPKNFQWGKGDLKSRIVVQLELPDFPCGSEFMTKQRCSGCQYQGIDWESDTLTAGDTADPKLTCPKEKYTAPDATFTFTLSDKGIPGVSTELNQKRRAYLQLTDALSAESIEDIKKETNLTDKQLADKLLLSRKESNLIKETSMVIKSETVKVVSK